MMQDGDRCIVVVADGAGGSGSGDAAAEMVVQQIKSHYKAVHSADDWASLLGEIDQQIGSGETTAVVVDLRPYGTCLYTAEPIKLGLEQVVHSRSLLASAPQPAERLRKDGAAVNAVMASFAVNKLVVVAFELQ